MIWERREPSSSIRFRVGASAAVGFCCIVTLSKRISLQDFWFFGQHCSEWQNESQSLFVLVSSCLYICFVSGYVY